MRYKTLYTVILLVVATLTLSWGVAVIVREATATAPRYPFVYYSSLLQRFLIREMSVDNKPTYKDTDGNRYTREQYDSLTPLLNFRQLMLTNSLPDSLFGIALEPPVLRTKTVLWRYNPIYIHQPAIPLYIMYESMSGRTNLESPDDVFRFADRLEFIDKFTNTVNAEKSARFQARLARAGFTFPARHVWGNLSPRKPYDEGYFALDSAGRLFHVKMVNGRPYVRNTGAGDTLDIAFFDILEVADRSIYGFVVTRSGDLYTLNTDGYSLTRLDIPPIDIHSHSVMLLGNLLYWIVGVSTPDSNTSYVLDAATLQQHDTPCTIAAQPNKWHTAAAWLFPVHVGFSNKHSEFVVPQLKVNFGVSLVISHLMFFAYLFTVGRRGAKRKPLLRLANACVIILFGIPGLIASLIIK
jgi:hypothetical protein